MRQFLRYTVNSIGFILEDGAQEPMLIKDFSSMGVGFHSSYKLNLNSFTTILYQNDKNQIIQMKVYIKNLRQISNSLFRVGALFVAIENRI